jgi:hypothetical protein
MERQRESTSMRRIERYITLSVPFNIQESCKRREHHASIEGKNNPV